MSLISPLHRLSPNIRQLSLITQNNHILQKRSILILSQQVSISSHNTQNRNNRSRRSTVCLHLPNNNQKGKEKKHERSVTRFGRRVSKRLDKKFSPPGRP